IEALAKRYSEGPAPGRLADLRERPRFVFCATDVRFRTQWIFDAGARRIGEDPAGYGPAGPGWTLAQAVAASSCVPGAFVPLRVRTGIDGLADGTYDGEDRAELVKGIDLSDGGVYDNLGLEPVWRDHAVVLVSDAAPSFRPEPNVGRLWRALRYPVTLLEQATDVRKRWLISSFIRNELEGAFWSINSLPTHYEHDPKAYDPPVHAYPDRLIAAAISQVRIDLDAFSEGEAAVLENHGYLIAEIAVRRHARHLVEQGAARPEPPHPVWMDPDRAAQELTDSHRTKAFARR
ncbi:MAG: patatin-like phospholipase family protein, partial [Gaiellaceae bacterium]